MTITVEKMNINTAKCIVEITHGYAYVRSLTIYSYYHRVKDWGMDLILQCGVHSQCESVVRYAVSNGADIHFADDQALRESVCYGSYDIVKYLVSVGANIYAKNRQAVRLAKRQRDQCIYEYLSNILDSSYGFTGSIW